MISFETLGLNSLSLDNEISFILLISVLFSFEQQKPMDWLRNYK